MFYKVVLEMRKKKLIKKNQLISIFFKEIIFVFKIFEGKKNTNQFLKSKGDAKMLKLFISRKKFFSQN